ncbi:hypothetical protein RR48_00383, partial [Papilio machaon]
SRPSEAFGEVGTELLGLEDPIDFEDEPVSKPSIQLNGVRVRKALDATGCFREIGVYIDVSSGPGATPEGLEVSIVL